MCENLYNTLEGRSSHNPVSKPETTSMQPEYNSETKPYWHQVPAQVSFYGRGHVFRQYYELFRFCAVNIVVSSVPRMLTHIHRFIHLHLSTVRTMRAATACLHVCFCLCSSRLWMVTCAVCRPQQPWQVACFDGASGSSVPGMRHNGVCVCARMHACMHCVSPRLPGSSSASLTLQAPASISLFLSPGKGGLQ